MSFFVIDINTRAVLSEPVTQEQATEIANKLNTEAGTRVVAIVNDDKRKVTPA